jgi:glutamate synthase domain-containing protein 3
MSGGVAFVLDADGTMRERCNLDLVDAVPATVGADVAHLHHLLERHLHHTGSAVAGQVLADWPRSIAQFTRVAPRQSVAVRAAGAAAPAEVVESAVTDGARAMDADVADSPGPARVTNADVADSPGAGRVASVRRARAEPHPDSELAALGADLPNG